MIHELRRGRQRPCLKLLNKADMADPVATKAWLDYFAKQPGVMAVAISSKKYSDVARIPALAQKLAPSRCDAVKPLRLMIMGIPNVGKSTLMNALVKKKVAAVGDQPAVTKSQQRIDISSRLTIYDTPGMLWPKIEHPIDGLMMAASHAVGVNAYFGEEVATFLIKGSGGEYDLERAAAMLLTDYRSGAIGRISLETPILREERARQLAEMGIPETATVDPLED
jgi:ribosome biogenesis GTPase A